MTAAGSGPETATLQGPTPRMPVAARAGADWAAIGVVALFPLVELGSTPFGPTSLRVALLLLVLPVGLLSLLRALRHGDRAARWAGLLGVVACGSALLARHPLPSIVGDVDGRTSAIVILGYLGCWALGRSFHASTDTLGTVLLLGGAAQAAVVTGQVVVLHEVEPYGTTGNSIFAAAVVGAALAVAIERAMRTRRWAWAACALPLAAIVCVLGSRAALGGVIAAAIVSTWRHPRLFAAGLVAIVAVVVVIPATGSGTVGSRLNGDYIEGGFHQRADVWRMGLHAWTERPALGWGPGRFLEATSPRVTLAVVHDGPLNVRFADAHDLMIEYLTTLGPVGLLAMLVLIGLAMAVGRGEARAAAIVLVVFHLLEPQSLAVTPLLFLFLGAALPRRRGAGGEAEPRRPPWVAVVAVATTAVLAVEALLIVGCDIDLGQAQHPSTAIAASKQARSLQPWWGIPSSYEDNAAVTLFPRSPSLTVRTEAIAAADRALRIDPTSPEFLYERARLDLAWHRPAAALIRFEAADRQAPWYPQILSGIVASAREAHQPAVEADAHRRLCELERSDLLHC